MTSHLDIETTTDFADGFNAALGDKDQALALKHLDAAVRAQGIGRIAARSGKDASTVRKALYSYGNPSLSTLCAITEALGYQIALVPKG